MHDPAGPARARGRAAAATALIACCLISVGCAQTPSAEGGPLGADLEKNAVCTPARGRTTVSFAEVLINRTGDPVSIHRVRATATTNLRIERAGARSGVDEGLRIVAGDPDVGAVAGFSTAGVEIRADEPFEHLVLGSVIDPR